jgi:hypothetical protein
VATSIGLLARQGDQGGDQRRGEDGDRGGEAQRPVSQLVQGSSLRWARTSPEEYAELAITPRARSLGRSHRPVKFIS